MSHNFHMRFSKAFYYRDTPEQLTIPRYETDSEVDMAIEFIRARTTNSNPFFLTYFRSSNAAAPLKQFADLVCRVRRQLI